MQLTGIALGGAIGMLLGLTGAGGGILAVPALVLGMGYTLAEARPVSLLAIGLAALLGCMEGWRQGLVRYRAALWMATAGLLFAPLGSWLAHWLPASMSSILFSVLMAYSAVRLLLGTLRRKPVVVQKEACDCLLDTGTGRFRWTRRCAVSLSGVGATAGILTGMFGVGGGFVIVPGLRRVSDISMHGGVATSLMVIATVSGVSAITMLAHGPAMQVSGLYFIGAAIAGMLAGRGVSRYIAARPLQLVFAAVTLLAAAVMLLRAIG